MEQQEKIIKCLTAFFRKDTQRIQGAVLFGSFGRGKGSPASDIDIELLVINDKIDIDEFTNDVIQLFNDTEESLVVKHTIWLAAQRKLALYHGSKLLLTELYLYCKYETLKNLMYLSILAELSQFDKYFLGSRIIDLSKCILVDREGSIHQHLTYILTLPYDDPHGLVVDLVGSIQIHLESTSSARQRFDAYKFYFISNITLHELVRLAYILDGKMEYK
jgi:predicted nucleotidyltransferase